jgi:hypothetical protein
VQSFIAAVVQMIVLAKINTEDNGGFKGLSQATQVILFIFFCQCY